jgi:hypothetical protein
MPECDDGVASGMLAADFPCGRDVAEPVWVREDDGVGIAGYGSIKAIEFDVWPMHIHVSGLDGPVVVSGVVEWCRPGSVFVASLLLDGPPELKPHQYVLRSGGVGRALNAERTHNVQVTMPCRWNPGRPVPDNLVRAVKLHTVPDAVEYFLVCVLAGKATGIEEFSIERAAVAGMPHGEFFDAATNAMTLQATLEVPLSAISRAEPFVCRVKRDARSGPVTSISGLVSVGAWLGIEQPHGRSLPPLRDRLDRWKQFCRCARAPEPYSNNHAQRLRELAAEFVPRFPPLRVETGAVPVVLAGDAFCLVLVQTPCSRGDGFLFRDPVGSPGNYHHQRLDIEDVFSTFMWPKFDAADVLTKSARGEGAAVAAVERAPRPSEIGWLLARAHLRETLSGPNWGFESASYTPVPEDARRALLLTLAREFQAEASFS